MAKSTKGFTLIEVIVSMLILTAIGGAGWLVFSTMTRANEAAENRIMAMNFIQMSLEDVRASARNNYDTLPANFTFDNISLPQGFRDELTRFGLNRTASISQVGGSSELKRVDLTVSWDERGTQREFHQTIFLSRPPDPLPGNIFGRVTRNTDNDDVSGVEIRLSLQGSDTTISTLSGATRSNCERSPDYSFPAYNFTFDDNCSLRLQTGDWNISVTDPQGRYEDYTYPATVRVESGKEEQINDISLTPVPQPEPATISGRLVNKRTGNPLNIQGYVYLYKNGSYYSYTWAGGGNFSFTINFDQDNLDQKCFTLVTGVSNDYWHFPYKRWYCGDFCDPHGWGKSYNYRGWSSSVVREDGGALCSNPWFGTETTDRLCVEPDDELVVDVPLVPVLQATVRGYVRDSNGNLLSNANIYPRWHDWNYSWSYPITQTDNNGYYEFSIPAEQELFPNTNGWYLLLTAGRNMSLMSCCNQMGSVWREAGWRRVGPLFAGTTRDEDFVISIPQDTQCGNADGDVRDGQSGGVINIADVGISGWRQTNNFGQYEFRCNAPNDSFYSIPHGNYTVYTRKNNYYEFNSGGNWWYNWRGGISIMPNNNATYQTINLWPVGRGNSIRGRIVDSETGAPASGANVTFNSYTNWDNQTITTGADGTFVFNNKVESWPSIGVVGNNYYNQNPRTHSITITHDFYNTRTVSNISLSVGEEKDLGDVSITPVQAPGM